MWLEESMEGQVSREILAETKEFIRRISRLQEYIANSKVDLPSNIERELWKVEDKLKTLEEKLIAYRALTKFTKI